jgi:hypothetical protein
LSAIPLNATRLSIGFSSLVSSRARVCAFSITDSVTTIERRDHIAVLTCSVRHGSSFVTVSELVVDDGAAELRNSRDQ